MPQGERLSAVAKRRRLNGNVVSIIATTSAVTSQPQPSTDSTLQDKTQPPKSSLNQRSRESSHSVPADDQVDDANSFSALLSEDVVHFNGFREVERLDCDAVKIRLSKGQKCIISGLYSLWVKEGVAEVLGAVISPSAHPRHVFATELLELPVITALSKHAEFEVRSVNIDLPHWSGFRHYQWVSRENDGVCEVSFYIHGYSIAHDCDAPKSDKGFNVSVISDLVHQIKDSVREKHSDAPPKIVLYGKQSPEVDLLTVCIINTLLTLRDQDGSQTYEKGVVILDLDQDLPSFVAPGTTSSVSVRDVLLGPAFTHLARDASTSGAGLISILDLRYSPYLDSVQQTDTHLVWLTEWLRRFQDKEYAGCPMLIKATGLTIEDGSDGISTIARQVKPSIIACFGTDPSSLGHLRRSTGPDASDVSVINIPSVPSQNLPLNNQRQLLLRSYLCGRGNGSDLPFWNGSPLDTSEKHHVWLTYGTESGVVSSISFGHTEIDRADTADALDGCIVAIVLQEGSVPRSVISQDDASAKQHEPGLTASQLSFEDSTASRSEVVNDPQPIRLVDTAIFDQNSPLRFSSVKHTPAGRFVGLRCLGLGVVVGIRKDQKQLCLLGPLSQNHLQSCAQGGARIHLIAQAADNEGRFDMSWLQTNHDMILEDRKLRKSIYRRRLHVK